MTNRGSDHTSKPYTSPRQTAVRHYANGQASTNSSQRLPQAVAVRFTNDPFSIKETNVMLNWIADKYDSFMTNDWWFWRWIVYAYLAVFAVFFVADGGLRATDRILNCEIGHLTNDPVYRWADCR
jgi:hypothetical protein